MQIPCKKLAGDYGILLWKQSSIVRMDSDPRKGGCRLPARVPGIITFFSSQEKKNPKLYKKLHIQLGLTIIIFFLSSDFSSNLQALLCWQVGVTFVLSTSLETQSSTAAPKLLYCGRSKAAPAFQGGFITNTILRQAKPNHIGYHEPAGPVKVN